MKRLLFIGLTFGGCCSTKQNEDVSEEVPFFVKPTQIVVHKPSTNTANEVKSSKSYIGLSFLIVLVFIFIYLAITKKL